jgi:hypothetical protein
VIVQNPVFDARKDALQTVIANVAKNYNFSNSELIIALSRIIKKHVNDHVKFTMSNLEYAPQALEVNKFIKEQLNDCINEIDKKRNTLRSVEKQLRKKYK